MPITVKIPAPLRSLTANQSEVAVENAATVQDALEELKKAVASQGKAGGRDN